MKFYLLIISLILSYVTSFSQLKYESESRLKQVDVPQKAKEFLDLEIKGLKWFKENSFTGVSIEAKFKIEKEKYSVEFDTLGNLQDIEIEIRKDEIPTLVLNQIENSLSSKFKRYKLIKIQKQLKGNIEKLSSIGELNNNPYLSGYEFVIKGISDDISSFYELFFNDKGEEVSENKVILKSTEDLEY